MLKTNNQKIALGLIIISIIYLIFSFRLPKYAYVPVDSDLVPIILGFILLGLSISLFFVKEDKKDKISLPPKKEILMILAVLGFILIYIIFLELLGFILVTMLFLFCCSWFLGYKKFITNALVSIIMPVFIYVLFDSFLQIQLPQGILPF